MVWTGKQKAAMLLMALDAEIATELLRGLPPENIQDIGMELARIDASGQQDSKESMKIAREFCSVLQKESQRFSIRGFLGEMLVSVLGKDKAEQIQSQIRKATEKRDPFIAIRSASTDELILALEGEHPQTIAVVLSEMPPKKSQEILSLLSEESRLKAVCKMTNLESIKAEVKQRMAFMVCERLKAFKGETLPEGRQQTLRKLAMMLSGLEKELRNPLLDEINKQDEQTATLIKNLMITWEDIPRIADRSLQESLRSAEPRKLATAIRGADEVIIQKIRSNISERAAATLDEESSLMQEPLEKEILEARGEIVKPLREANEAGTLRLVQ